MKIVKSVLMSLLYMIILSAITVLVALLLSFMYSIMSREIIINSGNTVKYIMEIIGYILIFSVIFAMQRNRKALIKKEIRSIKFELGIVIIIFGISRLFTTLFIFDNLQIFGDSYESSFNFNNSNLLEIILYILSGVIIAPIVEEFVFRSVIFSKLKESMNLVLAIVICAMMFSSLHFTASIANGLNSFIGGILLCWIYHRCKSVIASILAHMSFNLTDIISDEILKIDLFSNTIYIIMIVIFIMTIISIYFMTNKREIN